MSYHDFLQTGKIGCSVCYDTFRSQLEPLLRRIHGSSTHTGKIPHRSGGTLTIKHEIAICKEKLQSAVKQEKYEQAAIYRDKIKDLEQKLTDTASKGA
jgi:protein arginine kinase activator